LVEFQAQNVRSYRDRIRLSMESTAMSERRYVRDVPWRKGGTRLSVLPTAGIFGANASGKTNLLRAMADMRAHVLHSFRHGSPGGGIERQPFLLDTDSRTMPSYFEIDIVLRGVLHRYGFALDDERVTEEWAYAYPHGRPALLFDRDTEEVRLGAAERAKGRAAMGILRPNALFLSTAAHIEHPVLLPLYRWFSDSFLLADVESRPGRMAFTIEMLSDDRYSEAVLRLMRAADLGITGARAVEPDPVMQERFRRAIRILEGEEESPDDEEGPDVTAFGGVRLSHSGADGDMEIDDSDESRGTLIWFAMVGPVLRALADGAVLLADELDSSLHPELVKELVRMFQDPDVNTTHAQLVFNAHDTVLMGDSSADRPLGRDQIWFTRKLNDGSTYLDRLTEFEPRKQEAIGKRFLQGHYGTRPLLAVGDFDAAIEQVKVGR
jgi:hypothetical protein